MKKNLFILPITFLCFSILASAQNSLNPMHSIRELNAQMIDKQQKRQAQKQDELSFYEPDTIHYFSDEFGYFISVWKYNAKGLPILKEDFAWDEAWVPVIKYNFEYDENGNQTLLLASVCEYGTWSLYTRVLNEYNQNNQQTYEKGQYYYGMQSTWMDMYDTRITYDETTKLKTRMIDRSYNVETEQWENSARHLFKYNAEGLETEWKRQIWGEVDWVEAQKYLSAYEGKNRTSYTESSWAGSQWKDEFRYITKFENDFKIQDINQMYNNGKWDTLIIFQYSYNEDGDLLSELSLQPNNGSLDSNQVIENIYAENGDLLESRISLWLYEEGKQAATKVYYIYDDQHNTIEAGCRNYLNGEWVNGDNYMFLYYNDRESKKYLFSHTLKASYIDVRKILNKEAVSLSKAIQYILYPNPTKDNLVCEIKNRTLQQAKVEILDMQGRVLYSQYFSGNTLHLSTAQLLQGIYCLRIQDAKHTMLKNFVKQ